VPIGLSGFSSYGRAVEGHFLSHTSLCKSIMVMSIFLGASVQDGGYSKVPVSGGWLRVMLL